MRFGLYGVLYNGRSARWKLLFFSIVFGVKDEELSLVKKCIYSCGENNMFMALRKH